MSGRPSPERTAKERNAWEGIQGLGEFTKTDLMRRSGVSADVALDMICRWERKDRIHFVRKGERRQRVYAIGPRGGDHEAHRGAVAAEASADPKRNMWRAMQLLEQFTPTDLAAVSNVEAAPVSERDAQAYCQSLLRGEYLRVIEKARPGLRPAVYRLVRRTGPKPPVERRVAALFDANLGELTFVTGLGVLG